METELDQVGTVTSSASEEIAASTLNDVVVPDEKWHMKNVEEYLNMWIFRITEGDSLKTPPPVHIILFPGRIKEAWYLDRLVPWSSGFVKWETYMDYLKGFFKDNCSSLLTLSDAANRCVEKEKYLNSRPGVLRNSDKRQSKAITAKAKCMIRSGETSVVAAACFMCIAEEAELMSEHSRTMFSWTVRMRALELMCLKGSEYDAVAAAMLAMWKETNMLRGLLNQDNPNYIEISSCDQLRRRILSLFTILKGLFADGTDDVDAEKVTPADILIGKSDHEISNVSVGGAKATPSADGKEVALAGGEGKETTGDHDRKSDNDINQNRSGAVDVAKDTLAAGCKELAHGRDEVKETLAGDHDRESEDGIPTEEQSKQEKSAKLAQSNSKGSIGYGLASEQGMETREKLSIQQPQQHSIQQDPEQLTAGKKTLTVDHDRISDNDINQNRSGAVDDAKDTLEETLAGDHDRYATPAADDLIGESEDGIQTDEQSKQEKSAKLVQSYSKGSIGYILATEQGTREKLSIQQPQQHSKSRISKAQTYIKSLWTRNMNGRLCSLKASKRRKVIGKEV